MKVGFCFTGSFCTLKKAYEVMKNLKEAGAEIVPVFSYNVRDEDTRFFLAKDFRKLVEDTAGAVVIDTISAAEPLGPEIKCDAMIICPATGNTISKIAANITDTPVTMAAKAHLRNEKPLVIALATNDGLGANAKNIGVLLARKHIYFAPFGQDDPQKKPRSLVADFEKVIPTFEAALCGQQIQPLIF